VSAVAIARHNASCVLVFKARNLGYTFDHIISMVLRSGLYGGRYSYWKPASLISGAIDGALCVDRLSMTTMATSGSVGMRTCWTHASNTP